MEEASLEYPSAGVQNNHQIIHAPMKAGERLP
jgi:hypothetical protein